jgi:hypothetical protein
MTPERIRLKARAFREGWRRWYGVAPSLHCQVLALTVAIFETQAGDAWKGADGVLDTPDDERNWGATTLRPLNVDERGAIAAAAYAAVPHPPSGYGLTLDGKFKWLWVGVFTINGKDETRTLALSVAELAAVAPWTPIIRAGHEERAKAAEKAIRDAGLELPPAHIHCDSSPALGPYFVWFAAHETDEGAAEYFIKLLCKTKDGGDKRTRAVLENPNGTEQELAAAMYSHGYFTGHNDPKQPGGAQKNIDEYASNLRRISPSVRAALADHDTDPMLVAVHTGDTERPPPGAA